MFGVSAGDIGAEGTSCVAVCFLDDRKICFFDELIEGLLAAYGHSQRNALDGEDIPTGGGDLAAESNLPGIDRLIQLFVCAFAVPRPEAIGGEPMRNGGQALARRGDALRHAPGRARKELHPTFSWPGFVGRLRTGFGDERAP